MEKTPQLTIYTALPYLSAVYTFVETPTFARLAARFWDDESLTAFIDFIASNPEAGDVVPGREA